MSCTAVRMQCCLGMSRQLELCCCEQTCATGSHCTATSECAVHGRPWDTLMSDYMCVIHWCTVALQYWWGWAGGGSRDWPETHLPHLPPPSSVQVLLCLICCKWPPRHLLILPLSPFLPFMTFLIEQCCNLCVLCCVVSATLVIDWWLGAIGNEESVS